MISNLISDQTANNPAALAAQKQQLVFIGAGYQNTTAPGADGRYGATTAYVVTDAGADGLLGTADDTITEFGKDGLAWHRGRRFGRERHPTAQYRNRCRWCLRRHHRICGNVGRRGRGFRHR